MQPKQNPDATYGEKLIRLFAKLLFTGARHSLTDLSRSLSCSKQTVLRLIDDITCGYAAPIRDEIRGNRKYFWIERDPAAAEPAALLTEAEHRNLQMCRAFTEHLLGREAYREAESALEKSARHLPPGVDPAGASFGVVRSGVIDYSNHEKALRALVAGLEKRLVCEVKYRSLGAAEAKTFRIKPLQIFAHRESVYVHARKARMPGKPWKTPKYDPLLALQRFESARLTDVKFRRPAGYDFEKLINSGFGVWTQRRFRVEMELTGWAAAFAAEREWSPDQEIERRGDSVRLSFWSTSEPEVMSLAMAFGACARLVKPAALAAKVRDELAASLAAYRPRRKT